MSVTHSDATLSAYQRWAPVYPPVAHNPLMRAEERAMLDLWPDVAGRQVLDLACGSGRYTRQLEQGAPRRIVAADFCVPMLERVAAGERVCADMMRLPFVDGAFDVVISGLAVGHACSAEAWMAEVARVLGGGGTLLYSDFHPAAALAGLTRSFKDHNNQTCTVPHQYFAVPSQRAAARQAGLEIEDLHEVRVGYELTEPFEDSEPFYQRWHALPIVLVVRARKPEMA
jgi:ubiquinone/menaquinone biosynthesis C-methylase UbiE